MTNEPQGKTSVIKNIGFSTISMYLEMFAGLAISVIIARHLGPERYGVYAFAIWLSGITVGIANLGIANAAIKFIAEGRGIDDDSLTGLVWRRMRHIQRISIALVLLILAIMIPLVFVHRVPVEYAPVLWLLIAASGAKALQMFSMGVAKGLERFGDIAVMVMVVVPLNITLVILGLMADLDVFGFVLIYTIITIVGMLLIQFFNRRNYKDPGPARLEPELDRRIIRHVSLVSVVILIHMVGRQQIEIFFLSLYSTAENIAYFSLAYALARSAGQLLPGVINEVLLPIFSRTFASDPEGVGRKVMASIRYMILLSMPVALPGALLAEDVVLIVYGSDYLPAVFALQIFLLLLLTQAVSNPCTGFLISSDRQQMNVMMAIGSAIVNIALDIYLIPLYGLNGAIAASAITMLAFQIVLSVIAMSFAKTTPQPLVTLRILLAGLVGLAACWPLLSLDSAVLRVLFVTGVFVPVYFAATFLLRCWTDDDLAVLASLAAKGGKFTGWAAGITRISVIRNQPRF